MQQIKERPIIFNTEMIKAILDGRKIQTRRVVKPQPEYRENESVPGNFGTFFHGWNLDHNAVTVDDIVKYCPYGQVGDRLWMRETHRYSIRGKGEDDYVDIIEYKNGKDKDILEKGLVSNMNGLWRPSIHMPRWASRINLEITNIRIERVQDITEDDAIAEGIYIDPEESRNFNFFTAQEIFKDLWDSINEKRGYGWDTNPWVWVVEFKVL